ncbi:MAG: hypothetical protein Q7T73_21900 [Beijerinckiaceae bacterium]|nr:hypothetical protein [Beijerinckiaceae bacterium]
MLVRVGQRVRLGELVLGGLPACVQDVLRLEVREPPSRSLATAPIGWIGGNFEAGKNEHNLVTQVFKAVTGISPKDIAKNGFLGGENSELRKLANAAAGGETGEVRKALRFMDPSNTKGILGGGGSFFRKPFG